MASIEDVLNMAIREGWSFKYHVKDNTGTPGFQIWSPTYLTWLFAVNAAAFDEATRIMSPLKKWGLYNPTVCAWLACDSAPLEYTGETHRIAAIDSRTPPSKDAFRLMFNAYSRRFADAATVKEIPQ